MESQAFTTQSYSSASYVESAGAVLFRRSTPPNSPTARYEICLLHHARKSEYLLPKGRLNTQEARRDAAMREVREETGWACELMPVDMLSRRTGGDDVDEVDVARVREGLVGEAFWLQIRQGGGIEGLKLIWWFIAHVVGQEKVGKGEEDRFVAEWFDCDEALRKVTFDDDREVVRRAIEILNATV